MVGKDTDKRKKETKNYFKSYFKDTQKIIDVIGYEDREILKRLN